VKESANATIRKVNTFPQPALERLDFGWAQVPPGYCAVLLSCASNDCKDPLLETRTDIKGESCVVKWDCGFAAVVLEFMYYRTEPAGIPYGSIPVPISPL
jgi:hypothetical protein